MYTSSHILLVVPLEVLQGYGLMKWQLPLGQKKIGRPLKVVFNRDQLFNMVGYRPVSVQKVKLGADKDGKLTAIHHEAYGNTSTYEEFTANMTSLSQALYNCDNVST